MVFRVFQAFVLMLICASIACAESEPELVINPSVSAPYCNSYGVARRESTLTPQLDEVSGLVVSRTHCDIVWAHNDSGDAANLYAIRISTGELVSTVRILTVNAYDWEDIAIAPCEEGWCLFIGDIGDNAGRRKSIEIHRIPEPDPFAAEVQWVRAKTMRAVYEDGPHDAEALVAVDGDLYILSKAVGVSNLYHAPFEERIDATFKRLAVVEWGRRTARGRSFMATGADYLSDPPRLIVRGYFAMIEFIGEEGDDVHALLHRRANVVPPGTDLQTEAVGYGPNGYFHAAESKKAGLWFSACRDPAPTSLRLEQGWDCAEYEPSSPELDDNVDKEAGDEPD